MNTKPETKYRPSENEPYMNDNQLQYFRDKLIRWSEALLAESRETVAKMVQGSPGEADLTDRAAREVETNFELRTRDRHRKLLKKIEDALNKIEEGTYGYCAVTGEPIGVKRLDARPIATLSIEAQQDHEAAEKRRGN
ncbi:MAG: RNA polymerase-binding protein DksA [Desulfobacterales bacterium]|nr:RNA polymerase-binding protein DksA [Desulfobacterales bacterium]